MNKRKRDEPKQERKKYTDVIIKKLQTKNHRYYVLDSESIGLKIHID